MNLFDFNRVRRWVNEHRLLATISFSLLAFFLVGLTWFLIRAKPQDAPADGALSQVVTSSVKGSASVKSGEGQLAVDVKGAVQKPGLYEFSFVARLQDAIKKAGGLTADADKERVNLAQPLSDGMVIYIPAIGEETGPVVTNAGMIPGAGVGGSGGPPGTGAGGSGNSGGSDRVSLNQASQKELEGLDGIGPKKAEQIIAYREEHPFKSVDDLKGIPGIGPKRFEKLKDQVQL